jgi:hypothetical protein
VADFHANVFGKLPTLHCRDLILSPSDDPDTRDEKLAQIVLERPHAIDTKDAGVEF